MSRPGRMAQGDFGEDARMNQHQADKTPAFDLNSIEKFAQARNAPLCDISTPETFESIKATGDVDRALGHLCDLQSSESWESSTQRGLKEKFAQTVVDNAETLQKAGAWPKDLPADATVKEVIDFVREKAKAIFPSDTAEEVKAALPEAVRESPEPWGVDMTNPNFDEAVEQRVGELEVRVDHFNETSEACEQWAEAHGDVSPANGGSAADLVMPQPETSAEPSESASHATSAEPAESGSHGSAMPPVTEVPSFEPPASASGM